MLMKHTISETPMFSEYATTNHSLKEAAIGGNLQ